MHAVQADMLCIRFLLVMLRLLMLLGFLGTRCLICPQCNHICRTFGKERHCLICDVAATELHALCNSGCRCTSLCTQACIEQTISRLTRAQSKAHGGKAPTCTSLNRKYLPHQSTSLLVQNCANLVDAQTAFETAEAREQSSESAAANVAASVWPDTIVRENTAARVERLAWLRSMAKSTQTSATSGEYDPYCVDIYTVSAHRTETCLLVAVLCLLYACGRL